jgi:hypothetical protein
MQKYQSPKTQLTITDVFYAKEHDHQDVIDEKGDNDNNGDSEEDRWEDHDIYTDSIGCIGYANYNVLFVNRLFHRYRKRQINVFDFIAIGVFF